MQCHTGLDPVSRVRADYPHPHYNFTALLLRAKAAALFLYGWDGTVRRGQRRGMIRIVTKCYSSEKHLR